MKEQFFNYLRENKEHKIAIIVPKAYYEIIVLFPGGYFIEKLGSRMGYECTRSLKRAEFSISDTQPQRSRLIELDAVIKRSMASFVPVFHFSGIRKINIFEKMHDEFPFYPCIVPFSLFQKCLIWCII